MRLPHHSLAAVSTLYAAMVCIVPLFLSLLFGLGLALMHASLRDHGLAQGSEGEEDEIDV